MRDEDGNVSDSALRDKLTDDGRWGPDAPIRKEQLGFFIENSLELNSSATRDRNPGGSPHIPLGPN